MDAQMEAKKVSPGELTEMAGPPEIRRREAIAGPGLWAGLATTQAGLASGWHHHDGHDTVVYLLAGRITIEFADGSPALEAQAGDFLLIPKGRVHREITGAEGEADTVVIRCGGEGAHTVEVEDPSG
ncbi:MAG TPA: cupin domain-containing protein [Actinomycetota bacterium]|nr:cupin domain-containing protein [Actinomycetota bacterium]